MVRLLLVLVCSSLCLTQVVALTAEEIEARQYQAHLRKKAKEQRNNLDDVDLSEEKKKTTKPVKPPKQKQKTSTKYSKPATAPAPSIRPAAAPAATMPRVNTAPVSGNVVFDEVRLDNKAPFGIPIGTIIEAEIRRNISSAERGRAELYVVEPVIGKKRTMPVGTKLFADKFVNQATRRIEMRVASGVTPSPDDLEFAIRGIVWDRFDVSGVTGIVEERTDEIIDKSMSKGAIALGGAATQQVVSTAGGNVLGSAVGEATDTALREADRIVNKQNNISIVIYSSPQRIKIRLEKSI